MISNISRITGKCIHCSKRTQGKNSDAEFLCRKCQKTEEYSGITNLFKNMDKFDFGWLVGLIEGEGCFYCKGSNCKISTGNYCYPLAGFTLMITDFDVINRFAKLINVQPKGPYYKKSNKTRKVVWSVQITGNKALAIINSVNPHLGERRKQQIEKAIQWQIQGRFKLDSSSPPRYNLPGN